MGLVRPPIIFYAFDLLRLNGKDLQGLPIEKRKAKLEALLKKPPGVIRYSVSFTKKIEELLSRVRGLGLEGLIVKRTNSRYEAGKRTGAWVKIKLHKEQEFVIGGYTEPEGSRKHFGALLVGFYEGKSLKFAGRAGTGFSEKLLRKLSILSSSVARNLWLRCASFSEVSPVDCPVPFLDTKLSPPCPLVTLEQGRRTDRLPSRPHP
jgi:bifunctional non-homologous end joining protein LigD